MMTVPEHTFADGCRPSGRLTLNRAGLIILLLIFALALQGCSTSSKYFFLVDTPEGVGGLEDSKKGGVEAGGSTGIPAGGSGPEDGAGGADGGAGSSGSGPGEAPPADGDDGGGSDDGNGNGGAHDGSGGDGNNGNSGGETDGTGKAEDGEGETPGITYEQIYTIDARSHRLTSDVDEDLKVVLLTIDDGPRGRLTEQMLEVLHEHDVPALFFVNGTHFERYGDNIKQIHDYGHEVGNHGWSHRQLAGLGEQGLKDEIERTSLAIKDLTGRMPRFFRPAYGSHSARSAEMTAGLGMQSVNWSVDPRDWDRKGAAGAKAISDHIRQYLHPGAVILIHQLDVTLQALPDIIAGVRAEGYRFAHPAEIAPTIEDGGGGGGGGGGG